MQGSAQFSAILGGPQAANPIIDLYGDPRYRLILVDIINKKIRMGIHHFCLGVRFRAVAVRSNC